MNWKVLIKKEPVLALILVIFWNLLIFIISQISIKEFNLSNYNNPILGYTGAWDGGWYTSIINGNYSNPGAAAFYPLFPLVIFALKTFTFSLIPALVIGFLINITATWLAVLALLKITKHFFKDTSKWLIIGLFLSLPAAFFLHMFYTEAIFCALGFWAYYFSLKREWPIAAILLAFLTATRLPSMLFVALCGFEYLSSYGWNIKKAINKKMLWFLLAPIGIFSYMIFMQIIRGDFLAMFHAASEVTDWTYHVFNPNIFATIWNEIGFVLSILNPIAFNKIYIVNDVLPLVGIFILLSSSIYCLLKKNRQEMAPLGLFGLLSIILFTLNSNIISVHRYLLPVLTIYLSALSLVNKKLINKKILYICIVFCFMIQVFLIALFVNGRFAG